MKDVFSAGKTRSLTLGFVLLVGLFPAPSFTQDLRIGWHRGLTEPLVITRNSDIAGGILYDITAQLAQRLGLSFRFVELPRKRLDEAMSTNAINVRNYSNPVWAGSEASFRWSVPLFRAEDRILTLKSHPPILGVDDVKGLRIGTLLGYIYPTLDPLFEKNFVIRDDVSNLEQNFQKLNLRRIDGMVADTLLLRWISRGQKEEMVIQPLVLSSFTIHWAITPELDRAIPLLLPTLKDMVDEGTVELILSR